MSNDVTIRVKATDDASATFKQVQTNAGTMGKSLSDASKIASGFVLGEGLSKLPGLLMGAVNAASEDAASQARLKTAIDNTGASYGTYSKQVDDVIKKGQDLGYTDDQTRSALAILTAQTGSAEEAMKRYSIAQDLSRGANIDVVTASRLLGKVTDENVTALNRYGIAVQKGSSESQLFAAIQQKFGGQAAAYADTAAGKMSIFNDRVHEAQESVGHLATPIMSNLLTITINAIDKAQELGHAYKGAVQSAADTVNKSQGADFLGLKVSSSNLDILQHAVMATIPGLALLSQHSKENSADFVDFAAASSDLERHLNGLGGAITDVANKGALLVTSQIATIRAAGDTKAATEAAWKELSKSNDVSDQALVASHNQELADQAAAKAASEASKAKSAQAEADAAYAKTLPGMIDGLYKDADAENMRKEALAEYNREMGIAADLEGNAIPTMGDLINQQIDSIDASKRQAEATKAAYQARGIETDLEGNAIPTMQELVNQQEDSIAASIRQSKAAQQVALSDFPALVEQEKQSILASQAMAKATDEANRQLGIQTDTLKEVTAAWHQMTDAESQAAAKANASNSANTKPGGNSSGSGGAPASSGGSVAFFSSGYGRPAGGTGSATQSANVSNSNSQTTQVFGNVYNNYGSSTPSSADSLALARLN